MRPLLILLFPSLLLSACLDESSCGSSNTDVLEISFYQKSDKASIILLIDSVTVRSPQTTIYSEIAASDLEIPLVPAQNEIYIVITGDVIRDSVRVGYQFIPKLYAPGCDIELIYSDLEVLESSFDSLSYINTTPPRLEIFL